MNALCNLGDRDRRDAVAYVAEYHLRRFDTSLLWQNLLRRQFPDETAYRRFVTDTVRSPEMYYVFSDPVLWEYYELCRK